MQCYQKENQITWISLGIDTDSNSTPAVSILRIETINLLLSCLSTVTVEASLTMDETHVINEATTLLELLSSLE